MRFCCGVSPPNRERILRFVHGLVFLFWSGFFLHFGLCLHIRVQLHVKDPHGSGALSPAGQGGIVGFKDSASSLCEQVLEWSDLLFYLDVLISSCLQALSRENPDVCRDSCYLQSKKGRFQHDSRGVSIEYQRRRSPHRTASSFSINWMQCSISSNTARENGF